MSISMTAGQDSPGFVGGPKRPLTRPDAPPPATPGEYGSSDAYDRYMGRWSARLARQFLDFTGIGTAGRVLDVGAGTGSLTAAIATATGAERIVGVDPMPQFVRSAKQHFREPRMAFAWGDARELPFSAASFDATLAQLSLHHIANGKIAVGEMKWVTRSGGIVAACEWDAGPGMEMFHVL